MSTEDNSTNTDEIQVEIQVDTQQTPMGLGSPLWLLKNRLMKAFHCYQALKVNSKSWWEYRYLTFTIYARRGEGIRYIT